MARRRNDSFERELRRLATSAQWDKLRGLLEERLRQRPDDEEARQELDRLRQCLPLRILETPLERQRRQVREMREELAAELALFRSSPGQSAGWDTPLLRQRLRRMSAIRSALGSQLPGEQRQEMADYTAALQGALGQRLRRRRYRLALLAAPLLLALGLGTAALFHQRTLRLEAALAAAMDADEALAVELAARAADSGINRLVNPQLAARIDEARDWLDRSRRLSLYLEGIIAGIEGGRGSVVGLPPEHRADIERGLRRLPLDCPELAERWQKLCHREQEGLRQQVEEARQRFAAPLPPLPEPGGSLQEDDSRLRELQRELQQLLRDFDVAREAYGLPASLMDEARSQLEEIGRRLPDIAAMRRTAAALPAARSYNQYRRLLQGQEKPLAYEPALRMLDILDQLPSEEEVRDLMQDRKRKLPPGMLEAMRHALLEGGPSFTPAFHANDMQVALMEDIFTSRALRTRFYELSCEGEQTWLTEAQPEVRGKRLHFSPSPFDSKHGITTPRSITWDNPELALIRPIDTRQLMARLGMARDSFFRDRNLPRLLDLLMEPRPQHCPALAQAYLYSRLRDIMQLHEWPRMLGLPYAPGLRADFRSFTKLERRLGYKLAPGCWLTPSPARDAAEDAYAQWFRQREGRGYAEEIARNFGSLIGLRPRFAGYIDENGSPRLCHPVPEGQLLWYVSREGMCTTPLGEPPDSPALLSPLFTIEKD